MKLKIVAIAALCLLTVTGISEAGGRCGWGGGGGWGGGWGGGYCGPRYGGWGGGPGWGWGGWGGPAFGISVVSAPAPVYRTVYVPVNTTRVVYEGGYSESIVAQSQVRLARMGYYNGAIDGDFGPRTNRAIQHFQVDNGLPVTGRLDRRTLAGLGI